MQHLLETMALLLPTPLWELLWALFFLLLLLWYPLLLRSAAPVKRGAVPWLITAHVGLIFVLPLAWTLHMAAQGEANARHQLEAGIKNRFWPSRARVFLHAVAVQGHGPRDHEVATAGFSSHADLQLPTRYASVSAGKSQHTVLAEATSHGDLFELSVGTGGALTVEPTPGAHTRVVAGSIPRSVDLQDLTGADVAIKGVLMDPATGKCRDTRPTARAGSLLVVGLCDPEQQKLRAAFIVSHDQPTDDDPAHATPFLVRPFYFDSSGIERHTVDLAPDSLLQVGSASDALPGVTVWEVPAPANQQLVVYPPKSLLDTCDHWRDSNESGGTGFIFTHQNGQLTRMPVAHEPAVPRTDIEPCILRSTPPYVLEVRFMVPQRTSFLARAVRAALLFALPGLLCLVLALLGLLEGMNRGRRSFLPLYWFTVVSALLGALVQQRLAWSHRIDLLKYWGDDTHLTSLNELAATCLAACLAARAVFMAAALRRENPASPRVASFLAASGAWGLTFLAGTSAHFDWRAAHLQVVVALIVMSLLIGLFPAWAGLAARLRNARPGAISGDLPADLAWVGLLLLALLHGALLRRHHTSASTALLLAWTMGPLTALQLRRLPALRNALQQRGRSAAGGRAAIILLPLLLAILVSFSDIGVLVMIALPGLAATCLLALFATAEEQRLRGSQLARTLSGITIVAGAVLLLGCTLFGLDGAPRFPLTFTVATIVVLATGGALVLVWNLVLVRRSVAWQRTAGTAAAAALGVFALAVVVVMLEPDLRNRTVSLLLGLDRTFSLRIAAILDPFHLLLYDNRALADILSSWREAVLPPEDQAFGQRFFGAGLVDVGVRKALENDYLPVLLLRETGYVGISSILLLPVLGATALWLRARQHGLATSDFARRVAALPLLFVSLYQPLSSLGLLPETGIPAPGLGLDSPGEFWAFAALLIFGLLSEDLPAQFAPRPVWPRAWIGAMVCGVLIVGCAARGAAVRNPTYVVRESSEDPPEIPAAPAPPSKGTAGSLPALAAVPSRTTPPRHEKYELRTEFREFVRVQQFAEAIRCREPQVIIPDGSKPAVWGKEIWSVFPTPEDTADDPALEGFSRRFEDRARMRGRGRSVPEVLAAFAAGREEECSGAHVPHWEFELNTQLRGKKKVSECVATYKYAWPRVYLAVHASSAEDGTSEVDCSVKADPEVWQQIIPTPYRQHPQDRIRVVARAEGESRRDVAEIIARDLVIRLRPGAPELTELPAAGIVVTSRINLSPSVRLSLVQTGTSPPQAVLENIPNAKGHVDPQLLERPIATAHELANDAHDEHWLRVPWKGAETLSRLTLVLTLDGARSAWLIRPATPHPGEADAGPTVDWLVADDIRLASRSTSRFYVLGGLLPEVGSANYGLDGWIRRAVQEASGADDVESLIHRNFGTYAQKWCGTVKPPHQQASSDEPFAPVCARSGLDNVLECAISPQPLLALRLNAILESAMLRPKSFCPTCRAAVTAGYALLRGDTGEILAQSVQEPGEATTVFAPRTPLIADRLAAMLSAGKEVSETKARWNSPIASGSTLKPFVAEAAWQADKTTVEQLLFTADVSPVPKTNPCREGIVPLLGHCPPTKSMWDEAQGGQTVSDYLKKSLNWYQGALGLLGPGLKDGTIRIDDYSGSVAGLVTKPLPLVAKGLKTPLSVESHGVPIIEGSTFSVDAVRKTPFWDELEKVLGRTVDSCTGQSADTCGRREAFRDICAARELPLTNPSLEERRLVAIGSDHFNLKPSGAGAISVTDYLQFLRGGGLHPWGSLLQITDSFNRLMYGQRESESANGYTLAASWFPTAVVGKIPENRCPSPAKDGPVRSGLCGVIIDGTAKELQKAAEKALQKTVGGSRYYVLGAKTGTVDSLDGAKVRYRNKAGKRVNYCPQWNADHRVLAEGAVDQPYHLNCDDPKTPNDHLFVVSFVTGPDSVPLTLGLRFQGSEMGMALPTARVFLETVANYFDPLGTAEVTEEDLTVPLKPAARLVKSHPAPVKRKKRR